MRFKTVVVLLLSLGFSVFALAGKFNTVIDIGDSMPQFVDLPLAQGESLSSGDLQEDVVVLVSLANHCPWVQGMDAEAVAFVDQFAGESVAVVGFSVSHQDDDRLPAMQEHAREYGYNFAYVYDESQALGRALGATRTPEYFVFNKERKLVYMGLITDSPARKTMLGKIKRINGEPKNFYLQDAVRATLEGRPVEVQETRAHGCSVKYES